MNKKENKYKLLFQYNSTAIFLLEKKGEKLNVLEVNLFCEEIFGYTKEEFNIINFQQLSIDTEEKKEKLKERLKELKEKEKYTIECVFQRKNKETFYAETTFLKIEGVFQVLITDITEKKKEIFEVVSSFKNIVDNSPNGIFIFTNDKIVYKNEIANKIYNERLNNKKDYIFDVFPKRLKYLLSEILLEASDTINSYTEITLKNEENEKKYCIGLVKIVYDGINSILLTLNDITIQSEFNIQKLQVDITEETNKKLSEEIKKHRETQNFLTKNKSKLNALFESSGSLFIFTVDRDLRISSFNGSFKKMMKLMLDIDVELGSDLLNIFPIEEGAYQKLIKKFKKALRGESVELISHFPTKKGEIWLESFVSPVKVGKEIIEEIAFIAHNISEKVENEIKILDSEANQKATVSAIPDMLFKVNKEGFFTDFRLNKEGENLFKHFAYTSDLLGIHIFNVFKNEKIGKSFLVNIKKSLNSGKIHTQNFIIPFEIGKTDKKLYFENRYSKVNDKEVIIISRDVTDKVEFEERLIEAVKEKEVLLKEVHHRVKNNLQVISSILNLQSSYVTDEKTLEIINESQNRIRSMSYIHESLYQTKDFSSIDFHDYITNLVQNLVHSYQLYSGKTKLVLKIDKVDLVLDQAIPCGLILNELVSNSLKHAYPKEEGGEIQIEIKEQEGKIKIRIEDFGIGLPEGFKIEESDSLGLGLVDTLVDQIDGELILKTGNGTKYLIIFEKQEL